jgi:hypothetical protein
MIVFMPAVVAGQGGGAVLDGVLERVTFANPETGYTSPGSRRAVASQG